MKNKVIIIGLDGGTWEILSPLVQSGKTPFLASLVQNGAYGILRSTLPPVTATAWTSFITGKNPGKHGLFDFQRMDFESQERKLTFSTDCKSATLMDYLNEAGKNSLFINVPLTFPPQPINGINIAGFPVPPDSDFVYPPEMQSRIKGMGYVTDWMELYKTKKMVPKATLIRESDKAQLGVFSSLMQEKDWDVSMIVVSGTDHIAHLEWQQGGINVVKKHYIYIDNLLSELEKKGIFNDASIIVMSDHGFTGGDYSFYLNTWLKHEGYLVFKDNNEETPETYDVFIKEFNKIVFGDQVGLLSKILKGVGVTRENLIYLGKKTRLIRLEKYLPPSLISMIPSHQYSIDWSKTKAYMVSSASKGININLKGRESHGIVPPEHYEDLRQKIVNKLRNLKGSNGDLILNIADTKENIYNGPYVFEGPDIVTWAYPKYKIRMGSNQKHFLRHVIEAQHSLEGIFIFSGRNFIPGEKPELSIVDIAPIILHTLGLPVSDDMDGMVAENCFSESFLQENPVTFRKGLVKDAGSYAIAKTGLENTDVIEKLKALGYM